MKFVILNGSPKGENSNTIHYMKYIMKHRPDNEYKIIEAGRDIKKIEKDQERFKEIIEDIKGSDGIIWSFPLYHLSVPSQLMRFIELVSERDAAGAFKDKYAATLTTSVHYYDHLAHNYIRSVSEDLKMRYIDGFSADMYDIQKADQREQLLKFFDHLTGSIMEKVLAERKYAPLSYNIKEFLPAELKAPVSIGDKRIILITDVEAGDTNLGLMVDVFKRSVVGRVDVVNLNEINIAGGCLGCIHCGYENVCVYKDDLRSVYYEMMKGADAVVFAGNVKGRNFSSRWKMFFDRSFVNGHCPLVEGGQFGYIISGPLRQLPDMREELEARAQGNGNSLAGFVTDEYDDPAMITALVQNLAFEIAKGMASDYHRPPTFLTVGGHKIFRDLVYTHSGIFRADDRYYKKNGLYDYPQKDYKNRMRNLLLKILMSFKGIRREFYKRATAENAKAYQKAVDDN